MAAAWERDKRMAVRKRGNRWWFDFTVSGVRYRKPIPEARTKKKAEEIEDRAKVSVYNGTYGQPTTQTFGEFIDEVFMPWAKANYRSAPSKYNPMVKLFKGKFGHLKLTEISALTVERWKRERLAEPTKRERTRTTQSVNRELALLSRMLRMGVECGLLRSNPARSVKWFATGEPRTRYLTADEESGILGWLDLHSRQVANAVRLALGTGMRRGEITALRWADVDTSRGMIQIRTSKNGKPRVVPINRAVEKVLEEQRGAAASVFTVCAEHITLMFKRAARACGAGDLRFHDTRHSAATRMGAAGVDAFTLAEILGHSSIKQTRGYTHALESAKRRAVEALENPSSVTDLSQWRVVNSK